MNLSELSDADLYAWWHAAIEAYRSWHAIADGSYLSAKSLQMAAEELDTIGAEIEKREEI
jgi:hypothetical protein